MSIDPTTFFLFLIFSNPSVPEKKTLKISSDSSDPLIKLGKFGFTPGGQVSIALSDVSFTASDPSLLGFFLFSDDNVSYALESPTSPNCNPNNGCFLSCPHVRRIFTFNSSSSFSSYNNSFLISTPDFYSLFFANCGAPETTHFSFTIRTEMFNYLPDGSRDYLTLGLTPVPTLYSLFALAHVLFLAAWAFLCQRWQKNRRRIHFLMGGLLLAKALSLAFAAENLHYIRLTGSPLLGSAVLIYILQSLKGILFFAVVILISAGWSFVKPILKSSEKGLLVFVILLQLFANLPPDLITWNRLFLLVDVLCCFAVWFQIASSGHSLRRDVSKADGKAARNRAKFFFYGVLAVLVLSYLQIMMFIIPNLESISAYSYQWVKLFAKEAMELTFYVLMFYTFRPMERDDYFMFDFFYKEEEKEAAEAPLRVESV